jgi:hypothetical protein
LAGGSLGGDLVGMGVDLVVLDGVSGGRSLVEEAKARGRTLLTSDKYLAYKWWESGVVLVEA